MRKFKILVVALLCFGCTDRSSNKTNQAADEVSLSNTTDFIKSVNHPYFIFTLISKNISKKEMVFFDDHLTIKNEKDITKDQYLIDVTQNQLKCYFKTVYTDVLQLKTKEYDLQIDFKKKEKIRFIGYKEHHNDVEFYFKMASIGHSPYLTIHKEISNKKFLFEITDYLKINDKLL